MKKKNDRAEIIVRGTHSWRISLLHPLGRCPIISCDLMNSHSENIHKSELFFFSFFGIFIVALITHQPEKRREAIMDMRNEFIKCENIKKKRISAQLLRVHNLSWAARVSIQFTFTSEARIAILQLDLFFSFHFCYVRWICKRSRVVQGLQLFFIHYFAIHKSRQLADVLQACDCWVYIEFRSRIERRELRRGWRLLELKVLSICFS